MKPVALLVAAMALMTVFVCCRKEVPVESADVAPAPATRTAPSDTAVSKAADEAPGELPAVGEAASLTMGDSTQEFEVTEVDEAYFAKLGVPVYPGAVGCIPKEKAEDETPGLLTTDDADTVIAYYKREHPSFQDFDLGQLFGEMMGGMVDAMGGAMTGMGEGMTEAAAGMANDMAEGMDAKAGKGDATPAPKVDMGEDLAKGLDGMGEKMSAQLSEEMKDAGLPPMLADPEKDLLLMVVADPATGLSAIHVGRFSDMQLSGESEGDGAKAEPAAKAE